MPIAGRPTLAQLRRLLDEAETDPKRRERLFARLSSPRALVVRGLTDAVLNYVIREWDSLSKSEILDYGCGTMPYCKAFELAGAKVIGADLAGNSNAKIPISSDGKLPIADNCFDYIVSFQVLEHVPIPNDYLAQAYRILRPGGKIFLTTNGVWPYHPTPEDYHRWTRSGLIHDLKAAGFEVEATGHVLNDYSAAVESFMMVGSYRNVWKRWGWLMHLCANLNIWILEQCGRAKPEIPAVISISGVKR